METCPSLIAGLLHYVHRIEASLRLAAAFHPGHQRCALCNAAAPQQPPHACQRRRSRAEEGGVWLRVCACNKNQSRGGAARCGERVAQRGGGSRPAENPHAASCVHHSFVRISALHLATQQQAAKANHEAMALCCRLSALPPIPRARPGCSQACSLSLLRSGRPLPSSLPRVGGESRCGGLSSSRVLNRKGSSARRSPVLAASGGSSGGSGGGGGSRDAPKESQLKLQLQLLGTILVR